MSNTIGPVAIDDRLKKSLQDYVTNEIERGIRRQFDIITDVPGFIADNEPAPANQRFAKSMIRRVCRTWARGSTPIQGALSDFTYGPICQPYLESISEYPIGIPGIGSPFTGGQCVGALYNVNWQRVRSDGVVTNLGVGNQPGPIISVVGSLSGTVFTTTITRGSTTDGTLGTVQQSASVAPGQTAYIRNVTVVRVSGPLDCGNPPPVYQPPVTRPSLPDLTGQPVSIPGFGDLPVTVDFDNDGNIVVDFPSIGLTFAVKNPLLSDEPLGDDTPPGEQGTAGVPTDSQDGVSEGEDENRNLVGVKVVITSFPSRANVNFNSQGAYYKGAYYVYLGGDAGLSQHPAAIVKPDQFFYADKGSNRWRVEANLGYTVRVTPYFQD